MEINNNEGPLISPNQFLPEITLKALILGIILAVILGASNAYLALKVGTTVAASIPASVIALAVFRLFKHSNVLETNLVQTSASAGEGLAAAVTFIMPSLLIIGYWDGFSFWETAAITMLGGSLGVLFSIPLRRILLNQLTLPFPEGTAVGKLLTASTAPGAQLKKLIQGGVVGGVIVLFQTGFQVIANSLPLWFKSNKVLFGITLGFDPTLIGAGYIIGINAAIALSLGMFLCWIIGVPVLSLIYGLPPGDTTYDQVMMFWNTKIRYLGVGTMIVGGIWTMITLSKTILKGLMVGLHSLKTMSKSKLLVPRTERDVPTSLVLGGILLLLILCLCFISFILINSGLPLTKSTVINFTLMSGLTLVVLGFFSALVCGYLVGLIGSTNTPVSGAMIVNLLIMSAILFPILLNNVDLTIIQNQHTVIAMVIFVLSMIGASAVITMENIQDLKAGQMVGSTPWKQQLMLLVGVLAAALAIAPIMQLLFQAYGIGGVYPRPGMNPSQMLSAPQAALITSLAKGIVGHNLPWPTLIAGIVIGLFAILIDMYVKRYGKSCAVLAVGLGIYLPPEIITTTIFGGVIHYFAKKAFDKRIQNQPLSAQKALSKDSYERGTLLACGLVAGSSLMGVFLAVPFVLEGSSDALRLVSDQFIPVAEVLGFIMAALLGVWLFRVTTRVESK